MSVGPRKMCSQCSSSGSGNGSSGSKVTASNLAVAGHHDIPSTPSYVVGRELVLGVTIGIAVVLTRGHVDTSRASNSMSSAGDGASILSSICDTAATYV